MVPPPDDLVEVSLEMLSPQVVVDPDQSPLHLGDDCLGRVHVGTGLREIMRGQRLSESTPRLPRLT